MVKEVRGLGLMLGMEVQHDGSPDPDLRDAIVDRAYHHGLLLLPCGASTVRFCPPLCLTGRQVGMALEILGRVMGEVERSAVEEVKASAVS
jgi:4-aminobutyrate aminotransferase